MWCAVLLSVLFIAFSLAALGGLAGALWGWVLTGGVFAVCLAVACRLAQAQKKEMENLSVLVAHAATHTAPEPGLRVGKRAAEIFGFVDSQFAMLRKRNGETEEALHHLEAQLAEQDRLWREQKNAGNRLMEKIQSLAAVCADAAAGLARELYRMAQMVAEVNHGVEVQRHGLLETAEAVSAASRSVEKVFSGVAFASDNAGSSRQLAHNGQCEVREAACTVRVVEDVTAKLQTELTTLDSQFENIAQVMSKIGEVADQSNLLALNAAIEAARAGEAGRGFAVVAEEVQKLSQNTLQASMEIRAQVDEMRATVSASVQGMEAARQQITQSVERADNADGLMEEITKAMDEAASSLAEIGAAADTQKDSSARTQSAMEAINAVMESSIRMMHSFTVGLVQVADAVENLHDISEALEDGQLEVGSRRLVEWSRELETGIDIIDNQHKMLCAYVNALYRASEKSRDDETVKEIVGCLRAYTVTHFSTEEEYFSHSAYPDTEKHKQIHQRFVETVADVEQKLLSGEARVDDKLLGFLKDWLLNHIRVTDHQFVSYVLKSARQRAA